MSETSSPKLKPGFDAADDPAQLAIERLKGELFILGLPAFFTGMFVILLELIWLFAERAQGATHESRFYGAAVIAGIGLSFAAALYYWKQTNIRTYLLAIQTRSFMLLAPGKPHLPDTAGEIEDKTTLYAQWRGIDPEPLTKLAEKAFGSIPGLRECFEPGAIKPLPPKIMRAYYYAYNHDPAFHDLLLLQCFILYAGGMTPKQIYGEFAKNPLAGKIARLEKNYADSIANKAGRNYTGSSFSTVLAGRIAAINTGIFPAIAVLAAMASAVGRLPGWSVSVMILAGINTTIVAALLRYSGKKPVDDAVLTGQLILFLLSLALQLAALFFGITRAVFGGI